MTTGSAASTSRSASSGALDPSAAVAASIENRAARSLSPAASACWASIGRPSAGGLAALEQEVDHRTMDLAAPGVRQLARREAADLLVGEREVGRVAFGVLQQQARLDRRLERVGDLVRTRGRRTGDRDQVADAEAPSKDARVPQEGQRPAEGGEPHAGRSASAPPRARDVPRSGRAATPRRPAGACPPRGARERSPPR